MDFITAVRRCLLEKYADFDGRASRPEFWWWTLFNAIIVAAFYLLVIVLSIGTAFAGYSRYPMGPTAFLGLIWVVLVLWGVAVIVPNLAVTVRHPSPVRHLPPRGRAWRRGYETIATPVTLRAADPSSFEALPLTDVAGSVFWRRGLHVHEDGLWRPVTTWDAEARRDRPVTPDEILAYLRDDPVGPNLAKSLPDAFRGTPVLACVRHAGNPDLDADFRGGDPMTARERVDDPERTRRALRAFLDDRVRVAGDRAWLRATPLAIPRHHLDGVASKVALEPGFDLVLRLGGLIPVRPDRLVDALDGLRPERVLPPPGPEVVPPSRFLRDDDIALLANAAPGLVVHIGQSLCSFRRSPQVRVPIPDAVASAIEEMADLAHWGAIGAIGPSEAEPALLAIARAAETVETIQGRNGIEGDGPSIAIPGLPALSYHIRRIVLPRLESHDTEAEESLGALVP